MFGFGASIAARHPEMCGKIDEGADFLKNYYEGILEAFEFDSSNYKESLNCRTVVLAGNPVEYPANFYEFKDIYFNPDESCFLQSQKSSFNIYQRWGYWKCMKEADSDAAFDLDDINGDGFVTADEAATSGQADDEFNFYAVLEWQKDLSSSVSRRLSLAPTVSGYSKSTYKNYNWVREEFESMRGDEQTVDLYLFENYLTYGSPSFGSDYFPLFDTNLDGLIQWAEWFDGYRKKLLS